MARSGQFHLSSLVLTLRTKVMRDLDHQFMTRLNLLEQQTESLKDRVDSLDQPCIVHNCMNYRSQGEFIGALCSPCHEFITTGKGVYSQAYRNAIAVAKEA